MTTVDYAASATRANTMLLKYGRSATLARPSTGTPTYSGGVLTPVAPATYVGTGASFDYATRDIDGSLIKQGDQRLYLSALQTDGTPMPEPTTDDNVLLGAVTHSVKRVGKIAPAGVTVLYDLQLREVG